MLHIFLYWASNIIHNANHKVVTIEIDYAEIEAIYIPPDYHGPIVAIPSDDNLFLQVSNDAVSP
jgi:hypothetical protein